MYIDQNLTKDRYRMAKRPMKREKAIELTGKFMLLDGMDTLDFFVCGSIDEAKMMLEILI